MIRAERMLERRGLMGREQDGIVLLDAVRAADPAQPVLFFAPGTDPAQIALGEGAALVEARTVNGAPRMVVEAAETIPLRLAGREVSVTPTEAELGLLEGLNAMVGLRNGEAAETVLAWLAYHAEHHGAQGAVLIDRAPPGSDPGFAEALEAGLGTLGHDLRLVLVDAPVPLGRPDLPPESHPFCAPDAPGKDRMERPGPDPWSAPLAGGLLYEIARARFLDRARAVACLDVHDLLEDRQGRASVFDAAVASRSGAVALRLRAAYPWRLPTDRQVTFGDHICVQFDNDRRGARWCIAPERASEAAVWRTVRIGNVLLEPAEAGEVYRCMAMRHRDGAVSQIVPKSSLIEHPPLMDLARNAFGHTPERMPQMAAKPAAEGRGKAVIVTTMKNEGPFILEWLAHHRAIGFDGVLVYTNDCTDGTDTLLDLLQAKGLVEHRDNPFREMPGLKPQHAAFQSAETEPLVTSADWIVCMDVDEYVNIKTGDGTLDALFAAVPDANMIAMTWRLFGNGDIHGYDDRFITDTFVRCARELARKPHQAWGFKTLFRNQGIFRKLGVHRPKGLNGQLAEQIHWVNGSGRPLPPSMYRNAWRSTASTYGYDLVQLNHYAVRSVESFLVKRDRGRVNHVDRDQGLAYWFRMNCNVDHDVSIRRMLPVVKAEYDRLLEDPEIAAAYAHSVACHRAKIAELKTRPDYAAFYDTLTGARMQKLARLHDHFGANVFLSGPDVVPDEIVARDPDEPFFFTVERGEIAH